MDPQRSLALFCREEMHHRQREPYQADMTSRWRLMAQVAMILMTLRYCPVTSSRPMGATQASIAIVPWMPCTNRKWQRPIRACGRRDHQHLGVVVRWGEVLV